MFHPNGRYLLSAADDGSIRIWELKTGRCIRKIETGERFVSSLAWGRQTTGGNANADAKDGQADAPRRMNVIASGHWDYVCHSLSLRDRVADLNVNRVSKSGNPRNIRRV